MSKTIVILGGAVAGPTAAARAREIDETARIILVEKGSRVSYAACGLSFYLAGEVQSLEDLNRERGEFFQSVYNVEVWTGSEGVSLDAANQKLKVRRNGSEEELSYDSLVFAGGGESIVPAAIAGAANVSVFRTLSDLEKIKNALAEGRRRFVILGAGPLGLEAADGLVRAGAEVTILEKASEILASFENKIARVARASLSQSAGILTGVREENFEIHDGRITVVHADADRIETDFVICAAGITPRTDLLRQAGASVHSDGTLVIDESCATTLKNVYACGVSVSVPHAGSYFWSGQAAVADKTAQVAGENAAGGDAKVAAFVGSTLIRLPGTVVGRTGPSRRQLALSAGNRLGRAFIHAYDREPYMPESQPLMIELFYEKGTGRILALEAAGAGVERRIDAAAVAIAAGMTVHQLAKLDFGYSPALGSARDALNVAATVAVQSERGRTKAVEPEELKTRTGEYFIIDTGTAHREGVHMSVPLEVLRSRIEEVRAALAKSGAKTVACLSQTGRRGHLAVRILEAHGIPAVNVLGGARLSEI